MRSERPWPARSRRAAHEPLAHVTWGQGSPLLLLHGFTGSRDAWSHLRPLLGPRFQALAPDLPGHGESPPPDTTSTGPSRRCSRCSTPGDSSGWTSRGYSLGARVALGLALRAPDRVGAAGARIR